ncbi:MAG TPA: hypothetical protein VMM56_07815 [Planctomycetaceae bacterium]|nr:hypothetical protein [Planctomycetaceae bacterium]
MHTFGKVLTWLSLLLVIAGTILTGKAINVRNSWTEKVDALRKENSDRALSILQKESRLNEVRQELALTVQHWNRIWKGVDVNVTDANRGTLGISLGTNQGIDQPPSTEPKTIHGFHQIDATTSRYIGSFRLSGAPADNSSSLELTWIGNPAEIATWPSGQKWRFYESVPAAFSQNIERVLNEIATAEEDLTNAENLRTASTERNEAVKDQIVKRNKELKGTGGDPPDADNLEEDLKPFVLPVDIEGLLTVLSQEEESRDSSLQLVDSLRKSIYDAQVRLQALVDQSLELEGKLPKAPVDTADNSVR